MSIQDYRDSIKPQELIYPLSAKDLEPAEFVKSRSSSTWRASSADSVGANGVIRLTIASEIGWLCPETVRLQMTVHNHAPPTSTVEAGTWKGGGIEPDWAYNDLQPVSGPAFFQRVRVLAAGTLIEDIQDYGRLSELFLSLCSEDKVLNQDITDFPSVPSGGSFANTTFKKGIVGGQHRTVSFPLSVCGIFNTIKHIPLKYCPITLEITVARPEVCLAQGDMNVAYANDPDRPFSPQEEVSGSAQRPIRRSQNFSITNVQIKADLVTLDSGVDEQLKGHLLNGGKHRLRIPTYTTDSTTLQGVENPTLTMSRSLQSLKAVWVTFFAANKVLHNMDGEPGWVNLQHMTEANAFHTPVGESRPSGAAVGAYSLTVDEYDFSAQLAIGSRMFPDYPMVTPSEMYESLLRALGVHASNHTATSLRSLEYRAGDRFVLAWNLERSPEFAAYSGLSIANGENIQVKLGKMTNAYTQANNGRHQITKAWVTLEYDAVVEISATGVQVWS